MRRKKVDASEVVQSTDWGEVDDLAQVALGLTAEHRYAEAAEAWQAVEERCQEIGKEARGEAKEVKARYMQMAREEAQKHVDRSVEARSIRDRAEEMRKQVASIAAFVGSIGKKADAA